VIGRRGFVVALALAGCDRSAPEAPPPSDAGVKASPERWRELSFDASEHYPERELAAVLAVPEAPLLIALHGRGEAGRGLEAGARGWRDDYDLDRAHQRLGAPPLTAEDFHDFVKPERLRAMNQSLEKHPYKGLAVACPYTPALSDRSLTGSRPFAAFVRSVLVPRVRKELSLSERTGIDGVSMGGRLALWLGFSHPELFRTVGAMQPAIDASEAAELADLYQKNSSKQALRLVSSDDDPFLGAVRALSRELERRKLEHQLVVTPGPHDYVWNRGPGAYEMLLWHERALRDLSPP
jgi:predicted esterase